MEIELINDNYYLCMLLTELKYGKYENIKLK